MYNDWVPSPDIPFLDSCWKCLLVGKLIKSCSWIKNKITCSLLNKMVSQTSDKFADKIFMLVHVNYAIHSCWDCCHDKHTDIRLLYRRSLMSVCLSWQQSQHEWIAIYMNQHENFVCKLYIVSYMQPFTAIFTISMRKQKKSYIADCVLPTTPCSLNIRLVLH